jgi:hypothetical protein
MGLSSCRDSHVKTMDENRTSILQIGWKNSEIDTVHCKVCGDWKNRKVKN